jgi:hypothetical protein
MEKKCQEKRVLYMKYMQKFGEGFCILFLFLVLGTYLDNIFELQVDIETQVC